MIDQTQIRIPIKVIIAGGREFSDKEFMWRKLDTMKLLYDDYGIEVASGEADGADTMGEEWAAENMYPVKPYPPNYKRYGSKQAPLVRNEEMAKEGDVLCAFWDGHSRGTRHMIGCAMRQGLEVHIFRYKGESGD